MILSLLIWYFIPPQLCSPHCTTCVYCLKHTCQIKEKLMHLIFNYCPPQPPRTMGKCQSGRSARRHRRALMRAWGRQQEFEYWTGIETFPSSAAFSWHISLVRVKGIFFYTWRHVRLRVQPQKSRKLCKIQNRSMFMWEICIDAKTLMTVQIQATCFLFSHYLIHISLIGQ